MQDLFTQVIISDILQFLQDCYFNNIYWFLHFYIFILLFPSEGTLNAYGAPCQGLHLLGTQKTVSLDGSWVRQGNYLKISKRITLN